MAHYHKLFAILAACGLLVLTGCASRQTEGMVQRDPDLAITCFGVMPVQTAVDYDNTFSFSSAKQLKEGAAMLDRILHQYLGGHKGFRYVSADQVYGIENALEGPPIGRLKAVGAMINCNVMLEVQISRYVDRLGSEYTAREPASVAFDYRLVETEKNQVLCRGHFEEQQQYVLENLLTLNKAGKRGFTFVTAPELLREGVEEKFSQCGYLADF
ncbi:MAG: hypothetical protein CSA33_02010 [Desulfobulbus propionicus]|nr:MAG: hypothetical protein CSA33_02010 [Desulfobulbus propionicus]